MFRDKESWSIINKNVVDCVHIYLREFISDLFKKTMQLWNIYLQDKPKYVETTKDLIPIKLKIMSSYLVSIVFEIEFDFYKIMLYFGLKKYFIVLIVDLFIYHLRQRPRSRQQFDFSRFDISKIFKIEQHNL